MLCTGHQQNSNLFPTRKVFKLTIPTSKNRVQKRVVFSTVFLHRSILMCLNGHQNFQSCLLKWSLTYFIALIAVGAHKSVLCMNPVYNEHSVPKTTCITCK